jgi:hypothetical protein
VQVVPGFAQPPVEPIAQPLPLLMKCSLTSKAGSPDVGPQGDPYRREATAREVPIANRKPTTRTMRSAFSPDTLKPSDSPSKTKLYRTTRLGTE